ncbi:MAG: FlgD immunoglobulin-like domain containing protein, partial [bacterium]
AYEDYDGHNYLELRYSEPVTIGGLAAGDANTRAQETFGAGGWGGYVHDDGAGTVSVEGYFTYPGTFEGGSIDADRVTSSLYRTVEGEFNANSTHYATIVLTGFRDPAEEWIGYIESASDPGATAETIAVTANGEIEDGAASPNAVLSGSLVRHPVTVTPGSDVGRLDWDVDPPELARFRPYDADSEYHEIVALSVDTGANTDPQLTDRIELHFLDDSGEVSTWSSTNPAPPPLPRTDPSDGGIRDYLFQAALANGAFRLDFEGDETPRVFNGGDVTFDTNIVGPPENPFFEDTAGEEVDDMYVGLAIDDETVFNFPIEASLWMSYETSRGPTNAVDVITDHAGNRMEPFADRVTIERIPPRISAALAIAGTDRIYIRFSEWVYGANGVEFTDPAFNVNDYFEIVTSGGGYPDALSGVPNQFQAEFQPLQTLYRPVADKTVVLDGYLTLNTGTITQEGALDWRIVMRSSSPPIRYVEDEFTTPMSASTENRVSDVALGVVEPVAAWNSLQLEPGELEFGEEFTGLVSADQFDGSGIALADRDLTLQARIADAVNAGSPVVLYYDANVPERFLTPEGAPETPNRYWLPADSEITDDPDTPEAETIQENSDARRLLPEEIDGQFREYLIPSDDPEFNGGEEIEILLEIDGVPAARYTDANDPRSIAPWSITLQRFVEQRGGVTILNNVIYPENGEQTVVEYEVPRASMLTIHVLSLDGQLVRTLARGRVNEGTYRISWDGTNQDGQIVASGLYFVRVVASGVDEIRKVLVAK